MDDVNVMVDLVVGGSRRARENAIVVLLTLVKSNGAKVVEDIMEVNKAKEVIRTLVSNDNGEEQGEDIVEGFEERAREPTIGSQ